MKRPRPRPRLSVTSPSPQAAPLQQACWHPYRPLHPDELRALLDAAREEDALAHCRRTRSSVHAMAVAAESIPSPSWEAFINLMACCGLRWNEALQLGWSSVSLTLRTITFDGWKNRPPRVIGVADEAHALLLRLPEKSASVLGLEEKHVRATWRRICHRADLHDLPMGAVRCPGTTQPERRPQV
jgi:integrase